MPTERERRLPPRLLRPQSSLSHEPLRLHVDVEAHLLVHLRFQPVRLAGAGLLAIGLLACVVPGIRAGRIQPMEALRQE